MRNSLTVVEIHGNSLTVVEIHGNSLTVMEMHEKFVECYGNA